MLKHVPSWAAGEGQPSEIQSGFVQVRLEEMWSCAVPFALQSLRTPFPDNLRIATHLLRQELDSRFFRIKTVIPGSPAAETALQPSDLIEQINGISATQWTLEALEDALSQPGQTLDLKVAQPDQGKQSVKLLTRTLI